MFPNIVNAENAIVSPSKSVVLNEFSPDEIPAALDYYVGTFEAEKDGLKQNFIARTLFHFDINQINDIKNKHISNAYIELNAKKRFDFITDAEYEVSVHRVMERWQSATWNVHPEFDNNILAQTKISGDGNYIIRIKDIVKEWASNPAINHGILIKGIEEDKAKSPNLKQIESINLVVEYEDANECNRNGGICRKECGNEEEDVKYGCGFLSGKECCIRKQAEKPAVTTTTITPTREMDTNRGAIDKSETKGKLEETRCTKCPDTNIDGIIDIADLSIVARHKGEKNEKRL